MRILKGGLISVTGCNINNTAATSSISMKRHSHDNEQQTLTMNTVGHRKIHTKQWDATFSAASMSMCLVWHRGRHFNWTLHFLRLPLRKFIFIIFLRRKSRALKHTAADHPSIRQCPAKLQQADENEEFPDR